MRLRTRGARIRLAAAIVAFVGIFGAAAVRACEPCAELLDLDETARQADLIVVGEQVGDGPSTGSGPDWITVRIDEVLKGNAPDERIRVNGWDGMCPYGIVVEPGVYVMFLAEAGEMYDAVNYGCAVKTLPVAGENVEVDEQPMSLDELAAMLDLPRALTEATPAATDTAPAVVTPTGTGAVDTGPARTGVGFPFPAVIGLTAAVVGFAVVGAVAVVLLFLSRRER